MIAITPTQLKTTNLIFVDHSRLQNKVMLLQQQVDNSKLLLQNMQEIDSLREQQFVQYQLQINEVTEQKESLKKSLTRANWYIGGSVATSTILAIILLWAVR